MCTRILSTSSLVGNHLQILGNCFPRLTIAPFRSAEWMANLATAEALIVMLSEPITEADLQLAPRLKVIGTYSVGTNHLPIQICKERNIHVVNTPEVLTNATADLALAMLLVLSRRLKDGEELVRSENWKGWEPNQVLGMSVAGKVCGIIGSGSIGKAFARRVAAIGMEPVFWAREENQEPVYFGYGTAPRLPLKRLLMDSMVLSLHCPLTTETRGLISRENLKCLPPGALIINTARGGILDEEAAIEMLHHNILGGVGLDVYEKEPSINKGWFAAPRTVMLPHLGSATVETRSDMAKLLCEGIMSIFSEQLNT
jgi:glyoxylate reductase